MRTPIEALKEIRDRLTYFCLRTDGKYDPPWATELVGIIDDAVTACHAVGNAAAMHKGKWENGTEYEYEYAYCSECGRMQWAGWDSHREAEDNIESFANDYKFCPGCGVEMEGGVYVK